MAPWWPQWPDGASCHTEAEDGSSRAKIQWPLFMMELSSGYGWVWKSCKETYSFISSFLPFVFICGVCVIERVLNTYMGSTAFAKTDWPVPAEPVYGTAGTGEKATGRRQEQLEKKTVCDQVVVAQKAHLWLVW